MKELETQFVGKGEVRGFTFTQVKRSNLGYIYRVSDTFGQSWYEVFRRKENVPFNVISYPRCQSYGKWAWTCLTLEKAERKLKWINTTLIDT